MLKSRPPEKPKAPRAKAARVLMNLRLPKALLADVAEAARLSGKTKTAIVEEALQERVSQKVMAKLRAMILARVKLKALAVRV